MNGVRRFLGGGATTPTTSGPPATLEPTTPPSSSTTPLFIQKGPSWPPTADSPSSSDQSPPQTLVELGSPKTTTAALFFRRDRQRSVAQLSSDDDFQAHPRSQATNGISTMNGGARSSAYSSHYGSPRNSGSPVAGTSSPSPPGRAPLPHRVSQLSKSGAGGSGSDSWKRSSSMMGSVRDDLLMSLLASEAIVDSRGYEVLSAEEVEELKKEHQVLQSRLEAMSKKLALETKMRDAALSLSKANASFKGASKQSTEQLDTANRKVDTSQKEVWKISERVNEVQRRLLEHRASVLSQSLRNLERKNAPAESDGDSSNLTSGYSSPNRSMQMSPTSSSMTSVLSSPAKAKFDGAHFFAGHSDAVLPRLPGVAGGVPPQVVTELEEKLKTAEEALKEANAKRGELSREVSMLQLEKEQIETTLGMDVQSAEDTIHALEQERERMGDAQVKAFEEQSEVWMRDRVELDERRREVSSLKKRLEEMEERSTLSADVESRLEEEREHFRSELARRELEMDDARVMWEADRTAWEVERETTEQELRTLKVQLQQASAGKEARVQLDACTSALQDLLQSHAIPLVSRDGSIPTLVASIGAHLHGLNSRLQANLKAQEEWSAVRTRLEEDIRSGMDKREALYGELDQARKERDEAKVEARNLQADLQAATFTAATSLPRGTTVEYTGDAAAIVAILRPIWSTLPSPEARAGKMGSRFRTGSPTSSPVSTKPGSSSLSEMDVRTLKTLYDPKGFPSPSLSGSTGGPAFSVESFAERVQALIADDRALIERLIRFAQAHDLLKKNAERAQKLAQESNGALETYQKQVKMLEDRNRTLLAKQASLQDEVHHLQEALDRVMAEKLEIETHAAEQAETCAQLTEANNTLSARALNLAQEAASSTDHVRKQLERQLADANSALSAAKAEVESVRQSQQMTQMAMMEELNSIQTENDNLRNQLRAKK
ncbi:Up-regulated during septation-domain-containing protein [Cristinia sonorae]|uniref:Up-regulated during septation-domain-containing protein n=1 Tax=Cristinia sonorae TaxID=1940300 RepID=A0A8K0XN96_9AGAR|nr:Up-regulated during septation-domain-containing protein [Cristinia sonorae]